MKAIRWLRAIGAGGIALAAAWAIGQAPPQLPPGARGLVGPPGTDSADIPKPPYRRISAGPVTLNPGPSPYRFPYSDLYAAEVAAPEVHHVRYQDAHVRFIEEAYFPGVHGKMHGHPFPSVIAIDAPASRGVNVNLDTGPGIVFNGADAPRGAQFPLCATASPQAPHAETNQDSFPHHFYRLEFLRVDGKDFETRWREWYPHMLDSRPEAPDVVPAAGAAKFSADWPYPLAYDSLAAAPDNHRLLYEDGHVRLIEVTIWPGETERLHGHPYPSVFAYDNLIFKPAASGHLRKYGVSDRKLDPDSLHNGQDANVGEPPPGMDTPGCATMGPLAPHQIHDGGALPLHFYRIEFKRIDGDGLRTHWRDWYPWMALLKDSYDKSPSPLNY